jgi:hypothetical protein
MPAVVNARDSPGDSIDYWHHVWGHRRAFPELRRAYAHDHRGPLDTLTSRCRADSLLPYLAT